MIQFPPKEQCCGCMACKSSCPHNAISLSKDEKGFIYPTVDSALCVDCGLCMEMCCFHKSGAEGRKMQSAYAFRINDKKALYESTSGGAFTALSNIVLDNGGIVVGCVMDEEFTAYHIVATDKATRDRMRRSKYVQSNTDGIFELVVQELQSGKQVMFVGTPCQAAQMAAYSGTNRENLLVCDFLCHGVPNNDFFKAHIQYLEKAHNKKAKNYLFRGKKYGWSHMLEEIVFENDSVRGDKNVQTYSRFFYAGVSLRPSCRHCKYRCEYRSSDITIGDFWGINNFVDKTDNRGYSLVMVNTSRGQDMAEKLPFFGQMISVDRNAVAPRVSEPLSKSKINEQDFWDLYTTSGYGALVERYTDTSAKAAMIHQIKKIAKRILNKF